MSKARILRYGIGTLMVLIVFVIQTTILHNFSIRGIIPNLLVIVILSTSLLRGKIEGAIIGASLGIFQDIFFGGVVGFYATIYMFLGYLTGYLYLNFYKDSVLIPIGVIAAGDLVVNLIVYFFTFLFRGQLAFPQYARQIIIPELIYTILTGFLVYRLIYLVNKMIEEVEWSEEYEE